MARDPETRTFRLVVFGIFVGFSTLYILLIARGIILSLMHQGALPLAHVANECRRSPDSCAQGLADLRAALDQKSCELERTATRAESLWDDWSQTWQRDLSSLRGECCLAPGRAPPERVRLARAAADLERLGQLYTTHLVQYAREIGPQAERYATDVAVIAPAGPAPTSVPANP
jgi:hypothetical protein